MGIFSTISATFTAVCTPVIDTADAAGKTVRMATKTIDRYAAKQDLTQSQRIAMDTAKELSELQTELDADEQLSEIYDKIKDQFK